VRVPGEGQEQNQLPRRSSTSRCCFVPRIVVFISLFTRPFVTHTCLYWQVLNDSPNKSSRWVMATQITLYRATSLEFSWLTVKHRGWFLKPPSSFLIIRKWHPANSDVIVLDNAQTAATIFREEFREHTLVEGIWCQFQGGIQKKIQEEES
jgi:hypothetical protein